MSTATAVTDWDRSGDFAWLVIINTNRTAYRYEKGKPAPAGALPDVDFDDKTGALKLAHSLGEVGPGLPEKIVVRLPPKDSNTEGKGQISVGGLGFLGDFEYELAPSQG